MAMLISPNPLYSYAGNYSAGSIGLAVFGATDGNELNVGRLGSVLHHCSNSLVCVKCSQSSEALLETFTLYGSGDRAFFCL